MEDIFDILSEVTGITKYSNAEVITPAWVVKDMVDLLPPEVFNKDSRFLDPAVKSGRFLAEIYRRLMYSDAMKQAFPDKRDRHEHIIHNQLYGFATSATAATIVRKQLYNNPTELGNIQFTGDKDIVKEIRGAFENMKFDVVIGNPPYNNDIYLDFVTLGHNLASQYTCMITPARWQAKGGKKNEDFRKNIVPYMSNVVYFPDERDIFSISIPGGVSYFLVDKVKHRYKHVKSSCSFNDAFEFDNPHKDSENTQLFYDNHVLSIVNKCSANRYISATVNLKQSEYVSNTDHGEPFGDVEVMDGETFGGYKNHNELKTDRDLDKYKLLIHIMPGGSAYFDKDGKVLGMKDTYIIGPNQVPNGHYPCMYVSNDRETLEYLRSYFRTKLIRFLYFLAISATTLSSEFFRFIPQPDRLDHIFTDQELYQKYGLTDDEIAIIESVIKERK